MMGCYIYSDDGLLYIYSDDGVDAVYIVCSNWI